LTNEYAKTTAFDVQHRLIAFGRLLKPIPGKVPTCAIILFSQKTAYTSNVDTLAVTVHKGGQDEISDDNLSDKRHDLCCLRHSD
jgi:hypothetical protein